MVYNRVHDILILKFRRWMQEVLNKRVHGQAYLRISTL
jgi:hypothetical protein